MKGLKEVIKIILISVMVIIAIIFLLLGFMFYELNYAVHTADQSESPEGEYTLLFQAVGSPAFFSSADGRLVLKEGKKKITVYKFVLSDDGGSVRSDVWQVLWKEDHVEVIISGEEQDDELIQIYYDGEIHSEFLHTRFGTFP